MRNWITIVESTLEKWSKDHIDKIAAMAQNRFEQLQPKFTKLGTIIDNSGTILSVWGVHDLTYAKFYVADKNNKCLGYLALDASTNDTMKVSMVFVIPKFHKKGIGRALYNFALQRGIAIQSDATLTKASKAVWESMLKDPSITITLIDENGTEIPLNNIKDAFKKHSRRMIARIK